MVFSIGGVNILPYIDEDGLKWQRNDLDGSNAGRTQAGTMIRDRLAIKTTWNVSCRPLTGAQLATILSLIEPEFVTVQYTDPVTNQVVTKQMYSNNVPVTLRSTHDGENYWAGLAFPLIER